MPYLAPVFIRNLRPKMTTYYVADDGNDSNSGRTPAAPWLTLSKAAQASLSPGDRILFKRGDVWRNQAATFSGSGSAALPLTLGHYGDAETAPLFYGSIPVYGASYKWTATGSNNEYYLEAAAGGNPNIGTVKQLHVGNARWPKNGSVGSLLDHTWQWASTGSFYTIYLRDDSGDPDTTGINPEAVLLSRILTVSGTYYALDGLLLDATHVEAIYLTGQHNTVKNCEVRYCGYGVKLEGGHYGHVHNCNFHDLRLNVCNNTGAYDDAGCFGVIVYCDDVEVDHCTFSNLQEYSYDFGHDGSAVEVYAPSAGVHRLKFHHNYLYRCDNLTEMGASPVDSVIQDCEFYYNLIIEGKMFSFHNGGGSESAAISGVKIYNNSFYDMRDYTALADWNSTRVAYLNYWEVSPAAGEVAFRNNALHVGYYWRIMRNDGGVSHTNTTHTNNVLYRAVGSIQHGWTLDATEMDSDPLFVSSTNLHLQSGSPARGAGADVDLLVDYDGVAVPATPDIGAYQYVA